MTIEKTQLYDSLFTVEVKSIVGAYDFIESKINIMDKNGILAYNTDSKAIKNIKKEYKILKKYCKGKIDINIDNVYLKYPEESIEYFFLKCLVKLMSLNSL